MQNAPFNQHSQQPPAFTQAQAAIPNAQALSRSFLSNVFSFMFAALAVTGVIAWYFGTQSDAVFQLMYEVDASGYIVGVSPMAYVIMFAPLAFILVMGFGMRKMHPFVMLAIFFAYAIVMGISFTSIFYVYDLGSIYSTFWITAGTFGAMAVVGYTTKMDLSRLGGILMMALIGLVIAMVVNWFMGSAMLDYLISVIGVLIFTGLTAYDVQKLKRIGTGMEYGTAGTMKMAIWGALTLYLDFVNLFMFLLRLFGNRN